MRWILKKGKRRRNNRGMLEPTERISELIFVVLMAICCIVMVLWNNNISRDAFLVALFLAIFVGLLIHIIYILCKLWLRG